MNVKATEDARVVIIESGNEKVMVAQTPFGTMVTGEEDGNITFEPLTEVTEETLIAEFGAETAEKIGVCLGIVMQQIAEQLEQIEGSIDVIDEEDGIYLE